MAVATKRITAVKMRIGDLLRGTPILEEERMTALDCMGKKIQRVNVIGNIVDKYVSEGEKKYAFFTIDDGTGQISVKAFADDLHKVQDLQQGQTIVVIGFMRWFNNQLYITPEIAKETPSEYLLIRKLELEREAQNAPPKLPKEEMLALKDTVLNMIKRGEETGGMETEKIILEVKHAPAEVIQQEIRRLIEEGVVFEPRPGKVRWLG